MRIATILIAVAGIALGIIAWQGSGEETRAGDWSHPSIQRLPDAIPAGSEVLRFEVEGMCCDSCPVSLRERLAAVPGVSAAAVRFRDASAEAVVPRGADPRPLLEALNSEKYTARVAR